MIRMANLLFPDLPVIGYDNCADVFHSVRRQESPKSEPVHEKSSFPEDWAHYTMERKQCQAWARQGFFRFSVFEESFVWYNKHDKQLSCLLVYDTDGA